MQFKQSEQTAVDKLYDRVYAAMETGNHDQARTLVNDLQAEDYISAYNLRVAIVMDYGITL